MGEDKAGEKRDGLVVAKLVKKSTREDDRAKGQEDIDEPQKKKVREKYVKMKQAAHDPEVEKGASRQNSQMIAWRVRQDQTGMPRIQTDRLDPVLFIGRDRRVDGRRKETQFGREQQQDEEKNDDVPSWRSLLRGRNLGVHLFSLCVNAGKCQAKGPKKPGQFLVGNRPGARWDAKNILTSFG